MGERDIWKTTNKLEPLTQEIYNIVRKDILTSELSKIKWNKIELDTLESISNMLKGLEEK